jgi:acetolactate synthase-1/2/3 large subunit
LIANGAERAFCVPGESYLPVLDALYDVQERLPLIVCRHESGAANMNVVNPSCASRAMAISS